MTTEEQRIACAEELGWKQVEHFESSFHDPSKKVPSGFRWEFNGRSERKLPDFLNDANATLELVAHLAKWSYNLNVEKDHDGQWKVQFFKQGCLAYTVFGYTLAQAIAEAFLRVTGKWKE